MQVALAGCLVLPAVWIAGGKVAESPCTTKPELTARPRDGAVETFWLVEPDRPGEVRSRVWEIRRDGELIEVGEQVEEQRRHLSRGLENGREYVFAVRGRCARDPGTAWLYWAWGQREAEWHYGPWSNTVRVRPSAVESYLSSIDGHVATVSKRTLAVNRKARRIESVLGASLNSQRGTEADVEIVARETTKAAQLLEAIEPNVEKIVELVEEIDGSTTGDGVNVTNVTIGEVAYNETHVFDSNANGRSPEQGHFGAVYFDRGEHDVPMCHPNCEALTKALNRLRQHDGRVCVEGRASDDGPASYNLDLAEQRAEAVAGLLKCLVKPELGLEFVTLTVGEEHWLPGGFGTDPADRRVDIYACPASADAPRSKPVTLDPDCFSAKDDNAEELDCQQQCDGKPLAQNLNPN